MKKPRLMALALTAAITLSGVGYAYWTDAVTINNTVTTGEMNVRFVEGKSMTRGGDDSSNPYHGAYVKHENKNGGPATTITDGGKTVTTQVDNMYPGAYAQYYGVIENDGTIPVVFDKAVITFDGDSDVLTEAETEFKNNLSFAFGYVITDANGNKVTPNSGSGDGRYYASGKDMTEFEGKINTLLAGVRLEPGQRLSLDFPTVEDAKAAMESIGYQWNEEMHCITYTLSKDAKDDIENQKLGIHITIDWKQHNK